MFLLSCAVVLLPLPTAVLYNGVSNKKPNDPPWVWGLAGTGGTVSGPNGSGKVTLDTTANPSGQIGWLNVSPLSLSPDSRPSVDFDLRVVNELHLSADRAGLSVIVLGSEKKGVELSFWEDRVWVQNDNPLFTHGEEALFDTTRQGAGVAGLRRYRLTFESSTYRLSVDGQLVLTGPKRDYSAFNGFPDPYEIPNVLWVGDDTHSAQAKFEFSWFSVQRGPQIAGRGSQVINPR